MKSWSFADQDTGLFTGRSFSGPESSLPANTPPGTIAVPGMHDPGSARLDLETGEVVDWQPPKPADTELATWRWDDESRRWVAEPTTEAHWRVVRAERDRRLAATDWLVVKAAERGEPIPEAWRAYRQALRDVTSQPDPLAIEWPEVPK